MLITPEKSKDAPFGKRILPAVIFPMLASFLRVRAAEPEAPNKLNMFIWAPAMMLMVPPPLPPLLLAPLLVVAVGIAAVPVPVPPPAPTPVTGRTVTEAKLVPPPASSEVTTSVAMGVVVVGAIP